MPLFETVKNVVKMMILYYPVLVAVLRDHKFIRTINIHRVETQISSNQPLYDLHTDTVNIHIRFLDSITKQDNGALRQQNNTRIDRIQTLK